MIALSGAYVVPEARKDVFGDEAARKSRPRSRGASGPVKTRPSATLVSAKTQAQVIEAKDREHGTLFTKIATGDPTGESVVVFMHKYSGKK
ncbi:hypothetical protein J8F10_20485 [Gemmata sp. G18]|uniref:Uncharacterized protein n=1 Tax=Gemmata palustris TaxID=2822762 RepID=A0ABS5BVD8_9BACT|nr:hypothetical protein [Gemmata palustris]MBP3957634.1 hypothetical protein [Gemmata palustris]